MTFAPQNPIKGVVYPDPEDMKGWAEAGAITDETLADGFHSAVAANADRDAVLWLVGNTPTQRWMRSRARWRPVC